MLAALLLSGICRAQTPPNCSVAIPYTEGFNAAAITTCWSQAQVAGTTTSNAAITAVTSGSSPSAYPNEGTNMLRFYAYSAASGVQTRIMSSAFNTTGMSSIDIEYYWYHSNTGSTYNDKVQLQYSLNGTTWVNAGNEVLRYAATSAWSKKTVTLPAGAANKPTVYVAFLFTSAYGYNCYLDNVSVKQSATCLPATPGTTQNITSNSATINWAAPATAPASGYEYYYNTTGTAPTSATEASGTTAAGITTATINNLPANMLHYIWLRSNCGNGDKSAWSTVFSFTTACGSVNAPYTQNFDGVTTPALPLCFTAENVNADSNTWKTYSYTYNSSPNSAMLSSASGNNNDNLYTPGINMTAGTTYRLSFKYYIPYSYNYKTDLTVKYGTGATASGMQQTLFSLIDAVGVSSDYTFKTFTTDIVPAQTGTYYICFQAQDQGEAYIDDISVVVIPACSAVSFPASVTATASKTSICSSEFITFSLGTAMPEASGLTYQWKSSSDSITYTNTGSISTTATAGFTADSNNKYFKCDVLCNGTPVLSSSAIGISINVSLLSTTGSSRCGLGSVQLSAATQSGNTVKWYDSANSTTALGTGTTFTTPQIVHTTTFYAAATGTQTLFSTGAPNPGTLSNLASTNNAVETNFTVTTAISLSSVTIYPLDSGINNKIILKNGSGTVLQEYTFTITAAEANSSGSAMGSPKVVPLNWSLPAGDYKLQWDNPGGAAVNRVLRNTGGASSYYGTNNQGVTFTGNSGSGTSYWFYFYDWKFTTGCGESAVRVPVNATVSYEWTGAVDDNWSNPANWCGGTLPNITDDVTIPQTIVKPVIAQNTIAYAKSLSLANNTAATVATGGTLWVANNVTVPNNAQLTIENNGALVQVNNTENTGAITLNKKSNPLYRLDYTMWSSPVQAQNLEAFSPATSTNRFYEYRYGLNSSNQLIEGYWAVTPGDHNFETAKGYLIRMPNSNAAANYNAGTGALVYDGAFTGKPNNGDLNITLSTQNNRFTAVGNPYPSPISIAAFFAANGTKLESSTGIYLWRKRNNATSSSYATVSMAGYAANGSDATTNLTGLGSFYSGENTAWTLAPGQGFIVKTAPDLINPVLNFTNSMRRTAAPSQAFFKSAAGTASKLWINVTASGETASQALVAYMDEATNQIDYGYDAAKLTDATDLSLYSLAEGMPLVIQARPAFDATDVVPMGFTAPETGTYTISLDHTEGVFSQSQNVYVKDKTEGVIRNVSTNDYSFTSEAGTFENRFELVYTTSALGTDNPTIDPDNIVVYKEANNIFISTGSTLINSVAVFDIRGRQLYSSDNINAIDATINNLNIASQVLIITIDTAKGRVTKRIVF